MTVYSAAELLQRNGIAYRANARNSYTTNCPNCREGYCTVKIDREGVRWYCHSCEAGGGEYYEQRDEQPAAKPDKRDKPVAVYDYTDEDGERLYQSLRFEPKDRPKYFRQRERPDQDKWSIKGVRLVPFHLPELLEAIANDRIVFVVEGEKDVLTLEMHNFAATCNAMGAGKWRAEYNEHFVGADVVICGDHDEPGRRHVLQVAQHLFPIARCVRILELAVIWPEIEESNDISDWFKRVPYASGDVLAEIVGALPPLSQAPDEPAPQGNGHDHHHEESGTGEAPAEIPLQRPFVNEEAPETMPRRPWIVPGLLLRRQVTVMVAPLGSGKSLLTLQLGMICCAGVREWSGWRPRGRSGVLVINAEEDYDEMRRRLYSARIEMAIEAEQLANFTIATEKDDIVIAKADRKTRTVTRTPILERIVATIIAHKIDIVVVDPFAETFEGDENSNSELKWVGMLWREVARRANCVVLLVHHTRKYAYDMAGDMDALRGASALQGIARIICTLFTMSEQEFERFSPDQERVRYLRFDDAKANQNLIGTKARWFVKKTFVLPNQSDTEPGDEVGVLAPWEPTDVSLDSSTALMILGTISRWWVSVSSTVV